MMIVMMYKVINNTSQGNLPFSCFTPPLLFTVRNSSYGKVMFLHLSVSHSVHRGCLGRPPRQTPPWAATPLGRHPLGSQPPPRARRPLQQTVRILLECILVSKKFRGRNMDFWWRLPWVQNQDGFLGWMLSPACNRFLRFTYGATPADLLMAIIAAEPF